MIWLKLSVKPVMPLEITAVFAPFVGGLIAFLFGRKIGDAAANAVTCLCMLAAASASVLLFQQIALEHAPRTVELFTWIASGNLDVYG